MAERRSYAQWSFNGGELSPRMLGRVDQAIYSISTEEMIGWLPLLQGPALAAPGTVYVETANADCRLIPFEFNPTQGYVIEGSSNTFRFYTNDARIETAPGVPYQVLTSYSIADLRSVYYYQSEDVLYLSAGGQRPHKLSRTSAVTFSFDDLILDGGPFDNGNSDETITMHTDTWVTNPFVFASAAVFDPSDATSGRLLELECQDFNNIAAWEPGIATSVNTRLAWGGRVYTVTETASGGPTGITGTVPPEHDEGEEWDGSKSTDINGVGPYGVKLLFLYGRFALLRISSYVSPFEVGTQILNPNGFIPEALIGTPTWRWSLGVFSDVTGWPDTIGLWNDRLVLTKGPTSYVSVVGDFQNFARRDSAGDFQRDLAGSFTLPEPATINWQVADRKLLLGTDTAEWAIEQLQIQNGIPGPPVFDVQLQSTNGSKAAIRPVQADGRLLFLQRAGRKLRELGYAIAQDRYLAPDVTRLADHIGSVGFVDLAFQAEPQRLAWVVRGDGSLGAMTYDPEQQVMGWCRRYLGGGLVATSVCRITDPAGELDQLWISAHNPRNGLYLILKMAKSWEFGDDPADAYFVDAGLSYSGPLAQTFSDLDHLEGQTVDILADAKPHRQLVVAGGKVTLDYSAKKVTIGLPFPARVKLLPPEAGQSEGVARGKIKRVLEVWLQLVEAQGLQVTVQDCASQPIETRTGDDLMDTAVPLFTGIIKLQTIGNYEELGSITIERVQPTPATLLAVVPQIEVGEE